MKSGNICGLYWVALTHKNLSDSALHHFFCDVHMLSHLNGGKSRQEKNEYHRLQQVNSELSAKFQQEKKKRKELLKALEAVEKTRRDLEFRMQNLLKVPAADPQDWDKANHTISELASQNQKLKEELAQSQASLKAAIKTGQELKKLKAELESELWREKEINKQLFLEIDNLITPHRCLNCSQNDGCENVCAKRVLIGGMTKLKSFYREIIEKYGASFEYHDGSLKSGEKEMEGLIRKSDIILCPVDCNSHGACLSVKKICNRVRKPYQMLLNSSLSSISYALKSAGKIQLS